VKLAVPRECRPGERRVAVTPENVARLIKLGFAVAVEHDAGAAASFGDDDYVAAGAEIVAETRGIWQAGDIILKVQPPATHPALGVHEADLQTYGAISRQVVEQMALGGKKRFNTDFCLSVSGIAGPDGGTPEKPVGTVWIGLASEKGVRSKLFHFSEHRGRNIRRSALAALNMLREELI